MIVELFDEFGGFSKVINAAAQANIQVVEQDPIKTIDVNSSAGLNLAPLCNAGLATEKSI